MSSLAPTRPSARVLAAFCLLIPLAPNPVSAQNANEKADCAAAAGKAEPATPPDRASADGTAPGNSGSTGWTGGTGGAHIGTNPQGATASSTTWQPPTARGIDLAAAPETPPPKTQAPGAQTPGAQTPTDC
ncbi:hypothetical protein [Sinorhizobium meliloti]|uniref:hypothetical protein n=1 Tax=Rhizobium meliloti TaxID=382 RepID=UPI0020C05EE2|nr:hypothetical protein [Sinorhizobium meliloti]